MPAYRNAEDVWFWACTSLGLHRTAGEAQREHRPHRPEEVRLALDRLYRRRRLVPNQKLRDGHHTNARLRCEPIERTEVALRDSGLVSDGTAGRAVPYPHV